MTAALSITGIIAVLALVAIRINRQLPNEPVGDDGDRDAFTDSLLAHARPTNEGTQQDHA